MRSFLFDNSDGNVWDIEDLVDIFKTSTQQMCPYFAATRILTQDADIIFCPFSYMLGCLIFLNIVSFAAILFFIRN